MRILVSFEIESDRPSCEFSLPQSVRFKVVRLDGEVIFDVARSGSPLARIKHTWVELLEADKGASKEEPR